MNSYTSFVTGVWHTEIIQKLEVDGLDTLKHNYIYKDAVNKIRVSVNKLVDCCFNIS